MSGSKERFMSVTRVPGVALLCCLLPPFLNAK